MTHSCLISERSDTVHNLLTIWVGMPGLERHLRQSRQPVLPGSKSEQAVITPQFAQRCTASSCSVLRRQEQGIVNISPEWILLFIFSAALAIAIHVAARSLVSSQQLVIIEGEGREVLALTLIEDSTLLPLL
jgi:hypothetical protein